MLLEAKNLTASYDGIFTLKNINFHIDKGELVAVLGPNGSGKSTLLKSLYGVLKPRGGAIFFNGERIDGLPSSNLIRKGIVFIPQGRRVFPSLTVHENLRVMLSGIGNNKTKISELVDEALSFFPSLKGKEKVLAGCLSGGEQQMVALARSMLAKPNLLLLDEPSLGLSPKWVNEVFGKIKEINHSGTAIVLVEQKLHEALAMADRCYILKLGKVVWEGVPRDLIEKTLDKVYFGSDIYDE